MNGRSTLSATSLGRNTASSSRPGPFNQLYPLGSNVRTLSNGNYFSNIQNFGTASVGAFSAPLNPGSKGVVPAGTPQISKSAGTTSNYRRDTSSGFLNATNQPAANSFAGSALNSSKLLGANGATLAAQGNSKISNALSIGNSAATLSKSATGVASIASGPIGLAAQVSQGIGEAIGSSLRNRDEGISQKDYEFNSQQYSVGNQQNANAIRQSQKVSIDNRANAAGIGSLFGPIGALAGYFASSLLADSQRGVFNVNSFAGSVDPTDSSIAKTQSTANPSGESIMRDQVHDGTPLPNGPA